MHFRTILTILTAAACSSTALPTANPDNATTLDCVRQGEGLLCNTVPATHQKRDELPAAGLQKRCFHNGGGWYWCAFEDYEKDGQKAEEGGDHQKRDELPAGGLQKRCFHNGGGWYWCAFEDYEKDGEKAGEGAE